MLRTPEATDCDSDVMDALFGILGVEDEGALTDDAPATEAPLSDTPWVLSIEDDDHVALALKLRLDEVGVELVRVAAGADGYRRAFLDAPRAILLDYELPQGNGDYVLRRLKETPATRDIPVICLTGRREGSIERQMRGLGADEFLTKPFNWRRLWECLRPRLEQCAAVD